MWPSIARVRSAILDTSGATLIAKATGAGRLMLTSWPKNRKSRSKQLNGLLPEPE